LNITITSTPHNSRYDLFPKMEVGAQNGPPCSTCGVLLLLQPELRERCSVLWLKGSSLGDVQTDVQTEIILKCWMGY
jgi:hypothetical protein